MKHIIKILSLVLLTTMLGLFFFWSFTPSIDSVEGEVSISSLEKVFIGGVKQSLCIRGNDIRKPILLIVHGGPGDAAMPIMNSVNRNLELDFIVVNWDQRGAGKSFYQLKKGSGISIDTYVSDLLELTCYLQDRFDKEKIFILGHSWGSVLAMKAVQRHPELFYAYIAVGQVIDMASNEKLSYDFTLREAINRGDMEAKNTLLRMGSEFDFSSDWMTRLLYQRKLLVKFGGSLYGKKSYSSLEKYFLFSPEYSVIDIVNRIRGSKQSLKALWPELMNVSFTDTITRLEVPVYFFQGEFDFNTPSELLVKYFEKLEAPHKELIWFNKSAHFPQWEEPIKFHTELKYIALKQYE